MAIENRYLAGESCLETDYTFIKEGKVETYKIPPLGLYSGRNKTRARTGRIRYIRNIQFA